MQYHIQIQGIFFLLVTLGTRNVSAEVFSRDVRLVVNSVVSVALVVAIAVTNECNTFGMNSPSPPTSDRRVRLQRRYK